MSEDLVRDSVDVGVHVTEDEVRVTVVGVDDKDTVVVDAFDSFPATMKCRDAFVSPGHGVTMLLSG